MGRRKGSRNKAGGDVKAKAIEKKREATRVDRNRASPHAVTQLYASLTKDQRDAIVAMGQGSFLDIKCNSLHNPLNSWFVRCYDPKRRAFVVPCRGIIPLTEESVELLTGLPRGPLEVKYYVNGELEEEISRRLFPGEGSRPKVSDVAKRISQYKAADKTFKELWMVHIVSAVLAPTLDNHISNSIYPMLMDIEQASEMNLCKFVVDQLHENFSSGKYGRGFLLFCMLRYITALNTDDLVLELEDAPFAINSWTNDARDAVAALDKQEYDSTSFGAMQLRDEFKDVLSREMGLFGGPDGFESWMKLNLHPTCTYEQSKRAHSLMLSFASTVNGALINLIQGFTESLPCERCAEADALKGGVNTSQVESDGVAEVDAVNKGNNGSDVEAESEDNDIGVGNSASDSDAEADSSSSEEDEETEIDAATVAKEDPGPSTRASPDDQAPEGSTASPPQFHSQIFVPSDSELYGSDGGGCIGGFADDSPTVGSQQVDDQIRGSAAKLASSLSRSRQLGRNECDSELINTNDEIKRLVAMELNIPLASLLHAKDGQPKHGAVGVRVTRDVESIPSGGAGIADQPHGVDGTAVQIQTVDKHVAAKQAASDNVAAAETTKAVVTLVDLPQYNPLHKRKHVVSSTLSTSRKSPSSVKQVQSGSSNLTPSRRSPRFQEVQSSSSTLSPSRLSPRLQQGKVKDATIKSGDTPAAIVDSATKKDRKRCRKSDLSPSRQSPRLQKVQRESKIGKSVPDGTTAMSAYVLSPAVTVPPKGSMSDGKSAKTAFVVSPTVSNPPKASLSASKVGVRSDGKSSSSAIPISPTVAEPKKADSTPEENRCRDIVVSPQALHINVKGRGTSVHAHLREFGSGGATPITITPQIARLVKGLSDSFNKEELEKARTVGKKPLSDGTSSRKRKRDEKERDNRPGMFTPPGFDLMFSSQETSTPDEPIDANPLAWAASQEEDVSRTEASDDGFEELKLSEEVQLFIAGISTELSAEGEKELSRYEEAARAFLNRKNAIKEKAKPGPTVGVLSLTPKVNPHKARVKKVSRFQSSPYDSSLTVTPDQEDVYRKILLSTSRHKDDSSKLKSFRIIVYKNCWVFTRDLADSIHPRGELSNSCMEVGIEYLQRTNTIEGKLIMPYMISKYLMDHEMMKPLVIDSFKRTPTYSLSVMKRIHFPVMHEIARGEPFGNHWYCLSLNLEAERFEALDSLRGEGNVGLLGHANGLIQRIKTLWSTYYRDSKVQIENYELKVIAAPQQFGNKDCGYHVLHNIEKWDGQNIPQINKEDVLKMRKLFPYKWATASFNESKNWRWHLDNNKM